jgi:periplasmic divalent cation tolerance protein
MTIETDLVMIWSTWPDAASAGAAARILIERRLAACAVATPGARSVYRWQGEIEEAEEVVVWAKTRRTLAQAAIAAIVEHHPWDTPAVLVVPVEAAHPAYAAWVRDETSPQP